MGKIFFNQYEALLDSGENVEVLAIGDSWFHYPANNLMSPDCSRAADSDACYQAGQPDALFADVAAAYVTMLDAASAIRPGLPVLLHNYDYAIPNGKALPGVRNWLKLPIDNRRVPLAGAPAGGIRRDVVRDLIAGHTMMLSDQEDRYAGGPNVSAHLMRSAGTPRDSE